MSLGVCCPLVAFTSDVNVNVIVEAIFLLTQVDSTSLFKLDQDGNTYSFWLKLAHFFVLPFSVCHSL